MQATRHNRTIRERYSFFLSDSHVWRNNGKIVADNHWRAPSGFRRVACQGSFLSFWTCTRVYFWLQCASDVLRAGWVACFFADEYILLHRFSFHAQDPCFTFLLVVFVDGSAYYVAILQISTLVMHSFCKLINFPCCLAVRSDTTITYFWESLIFRCFFCGIFKLSINNCNELSLQTTQRLPFATTAEDQCSS